MAELLPAVREYLAQVRARTATSRPPLPGLLTMCSRLLATEVHASGHVSILFLCTHNSRRSQFSQLIAETVCWENALPVTAFSGGTSPTRVSPAAVASMRSAGFSVEEEEGGRVRARYGASREVLLFSKVWSTKGNPTSGFVTLTNCGRADESCPTIEGSHARLAILYDDPGAADGTPAEAATYDACRDAIARDLVFVLDDVARRLSITK